MAKLKGEFYTKKEANNAMDKINKYCLDVKVIDYEYNTGKTGFGGGQYDDNLGRRNYDDYVSRYTFGATNFMGIPMINPGSIFTMDWSISPYEAGGDMYGSYDIPVPKAILEAEVQDNNYSVVKERLYSCGAVSVY